MNTKNDPEKAARLLSEYDAVLEQHRSAVPLLAVTHGGAPQGYINSAGEVSLNKEAAQREIKSGIPVLEIPWAPVISGTLSPENAPALRKHMDSVRRALDSLDLEVLMNTKAPMVPVASDMVLQRLAERGQLSQSMYDELANRVPPHQTAAQHTFAQVAAARGKQ
jgi:hypothetical protein